MSALYIETSAILSWLFGEPDAKIVMQYIDSHENVLSSVLSIVETERALIRAESEDIIKPGEHQRLKGIFAENSLSWIYLEINSVIRNRAGKPFPIEPLRSLDAIHLATALEFLQIYPDLTILSFDKRIMKNLSHLGLKSAFY